MRVRCIDTGLRGQGGHTGNPHIVNGPIITHYDGGKNSLPVCLSGGISLRDGRGRGQIQHYQIGFTANGDIANFIA